MKNDISKLTVVFTGILFVVMGAVTYITGLNHAGAVILAGMGIPGIIAGTRGSPREKDAH